MTRALITSTEENQRRGTRESPRSISIGERYEILMFQALCKIWPGEEKDQKALGQGFPRPCLPSSQLLDDDAFEKRERKIFPQAFLIERESW
jgi:hypothetical protein